MKWRDTFMTKAQRNEPILNSKDIIDLITFKLETLEDLLLVGLIRTTSLGSDGGLVGAN